ncbi:permease [Clostridium thermarum]|uniref:permease n=1 Tax=Clostridium thermarum TaxID=1716543 RepID=UPI0013D4506B|nr:permease [Clostridium thermarum]
MTTIILYSMAAVLLLLSYLKDKEKTKLALKKGWKSFEAVMPQFLGIIFVVGMMLAELSPETISKIAGSESGVFGVLISAVAGSITIMPTFVAFSTANIILQNKGGYAQVAALVSALTLVGLVTLPMESKYIGKKAAVLRNFLAFLFSFVVAFIMGEVMV